jgi:hypothetical protein
LHIYSPQPRKSDSKKWSAEHLLGKNPNAAALVEQVLGAPLRLFPLEKY